MVERNTRMGPVGTYLASQVAGLADLLVGVLAGAPHARLVSLALGAQDHERAGALAPLPLQLPLGVILDQTLQLVVFRYC